MDPTTWDPVWIAILTGLAIVAVCLSQIVPDLLGWRDE